MGNTYSGFLYHESSISGSMGVAKDLLDKHGEVTGKGAFVWRSAIARMLGGLPFFWTYRVRVRYVSTFSLQDLENTHLIQLLIDIMCGSVCLRVVALTSVNGESDLKSLFFLQLKQ